MSGPRLWEWQLVCIMFLRICSIDILVAGSWNVRGISPTVARSRSILFQCNHRMLVLLLSFEQKMKHSLQVQCLRTAGEISMWFSCKPRMPKARRQERSG
jgi:hypothetical protein